MPTDAIAMSAGERPQSSSAQTGLNLAGSIVPRLACIGKQRTICTDSIVVMQVPLRYSIRTVIPVPDSCHAARRCVENTCCGDGSLVPFKFSSAD